ncbi:putative class ii aldolase adducin domain-containing protein [Phaeomoniella chlamydospora]|uniref:Putative class ii aldolase adducin domain-containing protein n=1 Tax=Phaeomoniella chlamydospora TaxID=158046 RepID=A0A0G2GMW2_PHACM|nr:putative class ii aldolase adducin domain-containing protein [Phaeomoniella chlamydospora]
MVPPTSTETISSPVITQTYTAPEEPTATDLHNSSKVPHGQSFGFPKPPKFTDKYEERRYLKRRLTLALRIFGKHGFDEGVAGHITIRDPVDPTTFWVNEFGIPFTMIHSSNLIHVNHHGKVIGGGREGKGGLLNHAAFMIHSAIHAARPDVLCAAHSHSKYGRTFTTLGREIDITTQDSCMFWNDHAVYKQFKGIVLAEEEGQNIAKALGSKKAALLQNHGLLTVGDTVEGAVYGFLALEGCCQTQLLADAAAAGRGGETIKIDQEDAEYTYKAVGNSRAMYFSGLPSFMVMEKELKGEDWDDQK